MLVPQRCFHALLVAAMLLMVSAHCWAEDKQPDVLVEITPRTKEAIEKGLAYLAARQGRDGYWGGGSYGRHVGITGLSCMAFMAHGDVPGRGKYGENVEKGLGFVLKHTRGNGMISGPQTSHGPMYGHGFATLFLAEVYGMTSRRDVRSKLDKAVKLIVSVQKGDGGWRYQPDTRGVSDLSVTVCQVQALRAARNAGINVPKTTMDRAIKYVKNSANAHDGSFRYTLSGGQSTFPLTGAGITSLYGAGEYDAKEIDKGLQYLMRSIPGGGRSETSHYFYGHYYAVQAMYQVGGANWQKWYPAIREELISKQREDGSWRSNVSPEYGTAMATLILQVPYRYMPIFQR